MASDQQFCLRWNNHQSTLVSVFDNLLESQTLVDCTLAADGQYLKAHKVVLSACSPYLEAILCQNLDKHPILILKDVKFTELKAMLDYMYRGEVNISQEQLSTFLKAAESLQIKGLTDSGGGGGSNDRERDLLKRQDLRKPLNQPVPHIPQPRPVVPHPGLLEPRRSLPHFPPHIADMQPQSPRHAREGSTSPTARKRRRPNRPSSDDSNFVSTPNSLSENQPDTSDSCDVPVKQSAPSTPSNVPNPSTKAAETDSPRTTPQPQVNSEQKQVTVKKEFSEALLTPKTEFDYGNDNSMEDVTYEDDEDEEVDLSKPGTSFATNSQGFPPWQMGGDGSNDDSNNMYSPDVTAAATQNNSQGALKIEDVYWNYFYGGGNKAMPFRCECGKTYPRYTSLWNHKRYRCGKQPQFSCSFCDHRTWHKCNLKSHMAAKHSDKMEVAEFSKAEDTVQQVDPLRMRLNSHLPSSTIPQKNHFNPQHLSVSIPPNHQASNILSASTSLPSSIPQLPPGLTISFPKPTDSSKSTNTPTPMPQVDSTSINPTTEHPLVEVNEMNIPQSTDDLFMSCL